MNTTPTKEQVKRKYENLQHSAAVEHFMKINTVQALEIDELKAYVNELREVVQGTINNILYNKGKGLGISQRVLLKKVIEATPAQSMQAHDAAIEEEVIAECDNHLIRSCGFANALDDMPRNHNV